MNFFNLDCHVSVISDLKQIFENLGHQVESWSISGHNWVFKKPQKNVDIINQNTWRYLNDEMCDKFYERYKDDLLFYDAFICTYPLTFSLLYERFNKPIILHIPIRYEVPFSNDKKKWTEFNFFLKNGIKNKKIIPVSNSLYDKKYFEFFTGEHCDLIPNICEYTNTKWENTNDTFLYYSKLPLNNNLLTDKNTLGKYEWSDISKYKGIVMIPYNCSTMSIFEFYTSNIPLFVPSKKFMIELYKNYPNHVLTDLTWNKVFNLPSGSIIDCNRSNDPNLYDRVDIMEKWIEYSDFYNEEWMPFITYFDNFNDLFVKLRSADLQEINQKMKNFNKIRKNKIYNEWDKIIKNLK